MGAGLFTRAGVEVFLLVKKDFKVPSKLRLALLEVLLTRSIAKHGDWTLDQVKLGREHCLLVLNLFSLSPLVYQVEVRGRC